MKNLWSSRESYLQGIDFQSKNDSERAITRFEESILWYFPGNPYVGKSVQSLYEYGESLEKNNPKMALYAFDSLRGSLYSIRSLYFPYSKWIPKVNDKIATLRTEETVKQGMKMK